MVWAVLLSSQRVSACEGSWGSAVPSVTHLLWTFGTGAACTRSGSLSCSNTCLSSSMALYIQQVNCGSARKAACDCGKTSCIGRLDFSRAVLTLCSSPLPPPHRPRAQGGPLSVEWLGLPDTNAPSACKSFSQSRVVYGSSAAYLIEWAENPKWG